AFWADRRAVVPLLERSQMGLLRLATARHAAGLEGFEESGNLLVREKHFLLALDIRDVALGHYVRRHLALQLAFSPEEYQWMNALMRDPQEFGQALRVSQIL